MSPKWSEAFIAEIYAATGTRKFKYIMAVTHVVGDRTLWENTQEFMVALGGNPIQVLDFETLVQDVLSQLTTTVASTSIGRLLQLVKAAKLVIASPSA